MQHVTTTSLFFFLLLFCANNGFAQQEKHAQPHVGTHFCAQESVMETAFRQNPALRMAHDKAESLLYNHLKNPNKAAKNLPPMYVLPVVVHIIHNNGLENISDATVLQGIQDLNDAFANVGYYDPTSGVDTKIQFCLAKRDPDGNATNGITRNMTTLTDMTLESDDITVKNLNRWDPTQYINIWLVREICSTGYGCGVAGYAYFPSSHGNPEDGIMMEAEYFGSSQGASGVQIHEMGHYLGLYHTFQGACFNNDCLADGDRVCDTPPDQSTAAVPCGATANSCSTDTNSGLPTDQNDLIEAYMDYGDFNCWSVFTQGQTDRMHWFVETIRSSLLASQGCQDPCTSAVTASFSTSSTILNVGGTVNFANTSTNATSADWTVNGTSFSSSTNASYAFNTVGSFEVCLTVGNADPNCSDRTCTTITVNCPVAASFSTSNPYPAPGQSVTFTNTSSNANSYAWKLNGTTVGTSSNFSYTFSTTGVQNLCLEASNGLCTATFCQQLFVFESTSDGECVGAFLKTLGNGAVSEASEAIIKTNDGNFLIGGNQGSASLITMVNPAGDVVWSKTIDMTPGNDFVFAMMLDSDGKLLVTGRDQVNAVGTNYLFKYDLQSHQILWSKQMDNPGFTRLEILLEKQSGGNYIVMGMAGDNNIFMEVNRNSGAVENMKLFNFGNTDHFLGALVHNNEIYSVGVQRSGGTDKIRASMTKLDLSGNQLWTRFYFNSLSENARTYFYENLLENNELVAYGRGDLTGSSFTDVELLLMKANLSGDFLWAKKYEIPSSTTEFSGSLLSIPDGYVLQGNHVLNSTGAAENFVMRVDKLGNLVWAKSIKNLQNAWGNYVVIHDGFIYLTGAMSTNGTGTDLFLGKMSLDGELLGDDCDMVYNLNVNVSTVKQNYDGEHPLTPLPDTFPLNNFTPTSTTTTLNDNYLPGCECQEYTPACDTSFLKTYGTPNNDELGHAIVEIPAALGGGFLIGGGKADSAMITRLDVNANIVWTRAFDATFGADDFIWDLSFDSDNNVIGSGQTRNEPDNNIECFVFKYNIATNNILWINELDLNDPAHEVYYSVFEKSPGGNYIVAGEYDQLQGGSGCNGIILELNRNTGTNVWQHHYTLGSCETFQRTILHNGSFYTTGRYNFDGGGTARMRPGITKMNLSGVQQWSKLYLRGVTPATNARLYSTDIVPDNGLVVLGHGDNAGTSTSDVTLFLYKTDNDGNLLWAMNYDIPGANTEFTTRLLNLPDGYLCLGQYTASSKDVFVFKTDKQGQLLWSKSYGNAATEDAYDMLYANGQIYFTGKTKAATPGATEDLYLANIGLDGTATALDSCNLFSDLNMTAMPYVNPYNAQHNLTDLGLNWGQFLDDAIVTETAVQSTTVCFEPCLDSCDVVPDALFQTASATCLGDSLVVSLTACNLGNFDLPAGTPVSFYLGNPTTTNAPLLGTVLLPQNLQKDSCGSFEFTILAPPNTTIFVMLNDDGTTPRPFSLADFMADVMECDYTNNLGSFILNFTAPTLELGPDVFLCENGVTVLDAGPGFASYHWQDGSIEQTLTAFAPGTYGVTVTDACGGIQSDAVQITLDSSTVLELGPDVGVCAGSSYTFNVPGFVTYQWSPADYLSCTDCPNPTTTPTANITYTLVATAATGCIGVDSVRVNVSGVVESFEDVVICEGDTAIVFGMSVTTDGLFSQTFTSQSGCDSIVTVSVGILPTVESFEDISICQGDTAFVFGMAVTTDGQFSQTFSSQLGCDSIVTVSVGLLYPVSTQENISICQGETVDVFGTPTGMAGTYSMTFNGANGCDSTHTIVLSLNTVSIDFSTENISCNTLGSVTASASGGTGPYDFEWSNGETTTSIDSLTAGSYTVTVTDANGCSSSATASIQGALGPVVGINIVSPVTEDEPGGGELTVATAGGTSPFSFVWSNGETTPNIDSLSSGTYTVTVTDANNCTATATANLFLPACTGGKIWNDMNRDGCQDPGETGIGNVTLTLSGTSIWGQAVADTTTSAINGEYIFEGLAPGDYFVKIKLPAGMSLSQPIACGDHSLDSDFSTSTFLSSVVSLVEGHCCLTVDGGLFDACLNITTTGEICCDQTLCGPGNDPAPITSVAPASGGGGATLYLWMYSTSNTPVSGGGWTTVPGANGPSYDPGPISQTTYFVRCAKSATCTTWLESNVVKITVGTEAVADILPPGPVCVNDPVTFSAAPNGTGATYAWNFGPWATPSTANQPSPTVVFSQAGVITVSLTVTRNGCTSTDAMAITVSNNPAYCGNGITLPGGDNGLLADGQFTVFPNPFSSSLTATWGEGIESVVSVKLYSVEGRLLHSGKSGSGELRYLADFSSLTPGLYLLRLQAEDGQTGVFRVVKE